MKLTNLEKKIVRHLQQGWVLITSSDSAKIQCCCYEDNGFHFSSKVFYRMVFEKRLLEQELKYPFNWVLSKKGKELNI